MATENFLSTFRAFIAQSDLKDALKLISFSSKKFPSSSIMNGVIFDILMKNCKKEVANGAHAYLDRYLTVLSEKRPSQYDFREVLTDKNGAFKDIWSVFSHLVESSFFHHKVTNKACDSSNFVQIPNCDILIDFYAKMLIKYVSLENDFFDNVAERFVTLLKWLNTIYKSTDLHIPILKPLHSLLDKKLEIDVLNDPSSNSYVYLLLGKCSDIFNNSRYVKGFFAFSNVPFLQGKICQFKLDDLIHKKKTQHKSNLTLKEIMYSYFFYKCTTTSAKSATTVKSKRNSQEKNNTISLEKNVEKRFFPENVKDQTSLHTYCRENNYGDLLEVLLDNVILLPNVKNSVGRTPLHEACLGSSLYCAKFLLELLRCDGESLNLKAADSFGLTPLHCAVYVNSEEIVNTLLEQEGPNLVRIKDKFGNSPKAYSKSKQIKAILEYYENNSPDTTSDQSQNTKSTMLCAHTMKTQEEYLIFLYALYQMLFRYLEHSNLYKHKKENVVKLSHKDRKCRHFVPNVVVNSVCDEDVVVYDSLVKLLHLFSLSVQQDADKIGANVKVSLIPFKMLCSRLASAA